MEHNGSRRRFITRGGIAGLLLGGSSGVTSALATIQDTAHQAPGLGEIALEAIILTALGLVAGAFLGAFFGSFAGADAAFIGAQIGALLMIGLFEGVELLGFVTGGDIQTALDDPVTWSGLLVSGVTQALIGYLLGLNLDVARTVIASIGRFLSFIYSTILAIIAGFTYIGLLGSFWAGETGFYIAGGIGAAATLVLVFRRNTSLMPVLIIVSLVPAAIGQGITGSSRGAGVGGVIGLIVAFVAIRRYGSDSLMQAITRVSVGFLIGLLLGLGIGLLIDSSIGYVTTHHIAFSIDSVLVEIIAIIGAAIGALVGAFWHQLVLRIRWRC